MHDHYTFPEADELQKAQRWGFWVDGRTDKDIALAFGLLVAPAQGRRNQPIMVLKGSVCRIVPGRSDPERAASDRRHLMGIGAIVTKTGNPYFEKHVIFPSLSRAAGVLCQRSENGWELWYTDVNGKMRSLAEAWELSEANAFELIYYWPPERSDVVVIGD
jgi:hypothetical protein